MWLDWFKGKSKPETIDFTIFSMGLSGFDFPLDQSIDHARITQLRLISSTLPMYILARGT